MTDDISTIVIDNGSGLIKAGFHTDKSPRTVFPTIVGRPRQTCWMPGVGHKEFYVGDEAQSKRGVLTLKHPMDHGWVNNWDDMEKIWHHTFYNELRVAPEEHPVVMTENALNPKANREKMTQIMFETFNTPTFYLGVQEVFALNAIGKVTGVAVGCGYATNIVPIYQNYYLPHGTFWSHISGAEVDEYLQRIMTEKGYYFNTTPEMEMLRNMKENVCYVAEDFDQEFQIPRSSLEKSYELPDGRTIICERERYRAPEVLFNPSLNGRDERGIHELVYLSIMKCDIDLRRDLYDDIILCGGSTLFPGMKERLTKEIKQLAPPTVTVNVKAPENRKYLSWIGAAFRSGMDGFKNMWVTKEEYDESGPAIVHRKCF